MLTLRRINTPSSWPRSWPHVFHGAIPRGNGTMLLLRWGCCSIKMRTLQSWFRKGSRLFRLLLSLWEYCGCGNHSVGSAWRRGIGYLDGWVDIIWADVCCNDMMVRIRCDSMQLQS